MADSSKSFHSSLDETSQMRSSEETSQKKRGRPTGSKNKPKPSVIISQKIEPTIKTVRIEIPYGYDIVEMIETFARHHRVGVNIENGKGDICNFSFHNTLFMSSGVFGLIKMTGTFVDSSIIDTPSGSSTRGALSPLPCSGPWLSVVCKGAEERVFSGIVAKKVSVFSDVVVVYATTFKSCDIEALDPTEYAGKGQLLMQHGGGYFGQSSSPSTHLTGARVGDFAGGLLGGGGGNSGASGGGTQQQNWGFVKAQQPVQHRGGHLGGSSSSITHPSGEGLGGVGESAGELLHGGGNSSVLGGETQQQNWDLPMQQQPVQHEGGQFGRSFNVSTNLSGCGLGKAGDSAGGLLDGSGNSDVLGGGAMLGAPTEQQNWDFSYGEYEAT